MLPSKNRRDFIKLSALGLGTAVLSAGLFGCNDQLSDDITFSHGVASGDPLKDRVILWTRALPGGNSGKIRIGWEVALDPAFVKVVNSGTLETSEERDFTIKIDAAGLLPGTSYYYRFLAKNNKSPVGKTKTLVDDSAEKVKLAVVSCSNYPAGRFHVYQEIAKRSDIDAVVHLGDYTYEYQRGGYASADAGALGREVLPETEILTLSDYRTRFAQYRTDVDLQSLHQNHPFIAIWDDHEVANNSWREGADNHQPEEGSFDERKLNALKAYSEWMPIRPVSPGNDSMIYRSFKFGRLITLHMLDTRLIGRDQPLNYKDYFSAAGFDTIKFQQDTTESSRSLLGDAQRKWLQSGLSDSDSLWHVLGQQVVMGRMYLPGALATQQISLPDFSRLVTIATLAAQGVEQGPEDLAFLAAKQHLLSFPQLPYNLDAWDGFEAERQNLLKIARDSGTNLVVLAGDSHNAWANDLVDLNNQACGVEFATTSVTSPGLEVVLSIPPEAVIPTEQQLLSLVHDLRYVNINERGFLLVSFTATESEAEYIFVDSVKDSQYQVLTQRSKTLKVKLGEHRISPSI